MNWNELKRQIDLMTPEQREQDVIILDEYDNFQELDDAIWYNSAGENHLGEYKKLPCPHLAHKTPYLTVIN